jgi:hypothetical protein
MGIWSGGLLLLIGIPVSGQDADLRADSSEGMGGAGVAVVEGVSSVARNPASLTMGDEDFEFFAGEWGIQGSFGVDISAGNDLLSTVDTLDDLYRGLAFQDIQSRLNAATPEATAADFENAMELVQALVGLDGKGDGVLGTMGGGVHLRIGSFAIHATQVGHAGISPFFDLSIPGASALTSSSLASLFGNSAGGTLSPAGTQLSNQLKAAGLIGDSDSDGTDDAEELAFHAQQALGEAALSDPAFVSAMESIVQATNAVSGTGASSSTLAFNGSGVEIRGVTIREVGLSASYPLLPGLLSVGVTVKEMIGETFRTRLALEELENGQDLLGELFKNFGENVERTSRMTIDLGVVVSPLPFLTVGLSAKNLVPVEFGFAGTSESFGVDPQFRLGVGVSALGFLRFGVDVDLLETSLDDLVEGLKSRYLGGGVEFDLGGDLLGLKLRTGGFTDLSAGDSAPVWTAGIGLKFLGFFLDLNGQVAFSRVEVESSSEADGSGLTRLPQRMSGSVALGFEVSF